jgi:hypothetical protein
VSEQVDVARTKDETATQLKGIATKSMLSMPGLPSSGSGDGIRATEEVKERRVPQGRSAVGLAIFIDQDRKVDAALVAKSAGVL